MMANTLSLEQIDALLKGDKPQPGSGRVSPFAPIIHVGPLRYAAENTEPCVSRNCRSPTLIRINGVILCGTHAIAELNRLIMKMEGLQWVVDGCTCNAGKYSYQNMHTDDCAIYERLKEMQGQAGQAQQPEQPGQL